MKKALIIVIVLVVTGTASIFFFISKGFKNMQINAALAEQLSPALLEQLKDKDVYDFPYTPATVQWDGKYLLIEKATTHYGSLDFSYNKELNEKLYTDELFPGNDINGIVWLYQHFSIVGKYDNRENALRIFYVLHYLDLKQNAVLAQDTVWGEMPPEIKNSLNSGTGDSPKEEDIITAIRNRIGD